MIIVFMGLIGVGMMGSVLVFNIVENGYDIVFYNFDLFIIDVLILEVGDFVFCLIKMESVEVLVVVMLILCVIVLLVFVGGLVEVLIDVLLFYFVSGDMIIDGGNSDFCDIMWCMEWVEVVGF